MVGFIQEPVRNEKLTIGTSSQIISEQRNTDGQNKRRVILIRNVSTGAQEVTINLGYEQASNGAGITLKPRESYYEAVDSGFEVFQGTISAISDIVGAELAIMER